jgi:hypothetical protein
MLTRLRILSTAWGGLLLALAGCDTAKFAVSTTSKVMVRAQPALQEESDYEMAARAIPATLKTVEGFHLVDPENQRLTRLLAEGYCQYGIGFIEDEWEQATFAKKFEDADACAQRATKAYLRCVGYALELLGENWGAAVLGRLKEVEALASQAGPEQRDGMLFLALGIAGAINMNRDDIELVAHLSKAGALLDRVVAIDDQSPPADAALRALPHVALGLLNTSMATALGGKPELGKQHFERAIALTDGKFLLAKVLFARAYGVSMQDKVFFREKLIEVLQTDPAIWPEQRLANEIAHRRARRYLRHEKEWF